MRGALAIRCAKKAIVTGIAKEYTLDSSGASTVIGVGGQKNPASNLVIIDSQIKNRRTRAEDLLPAEAVLNAQAA